MNKEQAIHLVQSSISGTRKGSLEPAYQHSLRVGQRLEDYGYAESVIVAGVLHDIVEDSAVTLADLTEQGFSREVIHLVDICSHDMTKSEGDERWVMMMARLISEENKQAWAIKIADIWDNALSATTMTPERCAFLRNVKAPLLASISARIMSETQLWKDFTNAVRQGWHS